jgi:hypothetical protein
LRKIPLLLLSSENIQEVWILKESDFGAKNLEKVQNPYTPRHRKYSFLREKKGEIPRVPI